MNNVLFKAAIPSAVLALVLSACGGGDEGIIVEQKEPSASGIAATMTVSGSTNTVLNGTYSSSNIFLNNVTKVNPLGGEPETCRFRFAGLAQQGSSRVMDGDIRYIPGTNELRTTVVSINTIEFSLQGTTRAAIDRANNRVVYSGAVLTSTQGTGQTITLTGAIPMRGDRPEGC
jgi:hypothetical protein